MEGTPTPLLLHEFHSHRFGETIDDVTMIDAEMDYFDDLVRGVTARREEIDGKVGDRLAEGWKLERLDRAMRAILRAGTYELLARPDVTVGTVIDEYLDIAHAFFDEKDVKFVNGLLDKVAKDVRR
jgi:N utilization substance protein B